MQIFRIASGASSLFFPRNFAPVASVAFRFSSSAPDGFPKEVTDVEKLEEDLFGRELPQNWTEKREKRYRHVQKKPKSTKKSQNTDASDQEIDKSTNLAYRDLKFRDPIIR